MKNLIINIDKMVKDRFGDYVPNDPMMRALLESTREAYKNGILDYLSLIEK